MDEKPNLANLKTPGKTAVRRPYQKVADQLMADIVEGKFAIGDRLPSERRLAEQFGVGRPVIREAIIALEIVNAVTVKPNSGIYVTLSGKAAPASDIDLDAGAFELLEARLLIEGEIAYLAAATMTETAINDLDQVMEKMREANSRGDIEQAEMFDGQFHELIVDKINNGVLQRMVCEMRLAQERSPLATRLLARIHGQGLGRRIEEHTDILTALRARDALGARAAMRRHIGCVIAELAAATELDAATSRGSTQKTDAKNAGALHRSIVRSAVR